MKKAIAVKYEKSWPAPLITAKGKGPLAESIQRIAEKNNILLKEDKELAECLFQFPEGSFVPEETFEIMAELLAFVYSIKKVGL